MAHFRTRSHLFVIAKLYAAGSASIAYIGAGIAKTDAEFRAPEHAVGAETAYITAIEEQHDMRAFRVPSSRAQTML
jgi:hypothetical protein